MSYQFSLKAASSTSTIVDRSTLTLLEHINLNIPNHDHIDLYFKVLGCGMDPRKAQNLKPGAAKKTLWANCGASQFHLPKGEVGQKIPGHIGLRVTSLADLKERLQTGKEHCESFHEGNDSRTGRPHIYIQDHYGNAFICREPHQQTQSKSASLQQPFIKPSDSHWGSIATEYGREQTECLGIDYVEFSCRPQQAERIAMFYEALLDATTNVVSLDATGQQKAAVIGVGNIDETGKAEQSLLFRETSDPIPEYDGHHIALYVGESAQDFEQAFKNALLANVVWKNPRFSDQVDNLEEARKEQQFRFKEIIDIETGVPIMELEHEMRSINHPSWPGDKQG